MEGGTEELVFISYMEFPDPLDKADSFLGFICLKSRTDDEGDHRTERHANAGLGKRLKVKQWLVMEAFGSMERTVHMICSFSDTDQFWKGWYWSQQKFYETGFTKAGCRYGVVG